MGGEGEVGEKCVVVVGGRKQLPSPSPIRAGNEGGRGGGGGEALYSFVQEDSPGNRTGERMEARSGEGMKAPFETPNINECIPMPSA